MKGGTISSEGPGLINYVSTGNHRLKTHFKMIITMSITTDNLETLVVNIV